MYNYSVNNKILDNLKKVKLFFLYLLIFILPISKAGTEITFAVLVFLWFSIRIFAKTRISDYFPRTKLNLPLCLFLLVCFLSIFHSVEPKESMRGFLSRWVKFTMVYFIFIDTVDSPKKMKTALKVFTLSFSLLLLDGVYQFFAGSDLLLSFPLEGSFWITATFRSLNTFGGYLVLSAPIILCFLWQNVSKIFFKICFIFILPLLLFCFILSNSASSWIALLVALVVFGIFSRYKKQFLIWALLFNLCLMSILVLQPLFRDRVFVDLSQQMDLTKGGRLAIWRDTLKEIAKNPFLGKGVHTTRGYVVAKYSSSPLFKRYAHTHNLFLHITLELGIIGLFIFLWIIWIILKTIFSLLGKIYLFYGLGTGLLAFLITNLVDTHMGEQIVISFFIVIAMIMNYQERWQEWAQESRQL